MKTSMSRTIGYSIARLDASKRGALFDVAAISATDAWAVGGTPEGGTAAPNDVVLHWDGTAWKQEMLPMALAVAGVTGIYVWERNQRVAEVEEIDAMLLTDDLPIDD